MCLSFTASLCFCKISCWSQSLITEFLNSANIYYDYSNGFPQSMRVFFNTPPQDTKPLSFPPFIAHFTFLSQDIIAFFFLFFFFVLLYLLLHPASPMLTVLWAKLVQTAAGSSASGVSADTSVSSLGGIIWFMIHSGLNNHCGIM